MTLRTHLASLALVFALGTAAQADSCDGLTVRLIRETGVALAGRSGATVVFRAADANRMSLDCAMPRRLAFRSDLREPPRGFFVLIGLAARTLAGAPADSVETLAQRLHQDSLLTGAPQLGRVGGAVVRCDPGDRPDGFGVGSLCRLAAERPGRGLSRAAAPG
ncbi:MULTISPECIES: hypothetical protein [Methylorubrum]|uniref:hypothetical protein n=1 Tax=Methylorubrum TaxID=2282523 RepID=UPI00209C9F06|nr:MULTISPECIES: hypothetical protein [Methylorubrum]MCP1548675.1 hypothetical protein [Methylorubrum zatmanii]MCP1554711.1 hypothetical protein [Methylorubrum extorquens]MCP1578978.1 hypothetical protein [Methylorubrum extorquens]